jgi:hypothetical protein
MQITINVNVDDRILRVARGVFSKRTARAGAVVLAILGASLLVFGDAITKPNTFAAGEVVSAAEMNDNFDTVYAKVNTLDASVTSLQTVIGSLNASSSYWAYNAGALSYQGGYVGIGTGSPATALDVAGTVSATGLNVTGAAALGATTATGLTVSGATALGTTTATSVTASGNVTAAAFVGDGSGLTGMPPWTVSGGSMSYTGYVGVGTTTPAASLHIRGWELLKLQSVGWSGDYWRVMHVATDGTADYGLAFQRGTESYMVLGGPQPFVGSYFPKGNIGIGESAQGGFDLWLRDGPGASAQTWNTRSSIRYKEDVRPVDNALDKVMQLQGVEFTWKSTKAHSIGFVAEEAGKVVPELVTYEANGTDAIGMDYSKVTVLLVEALKTQEKRIAELEAKVAELSAR